MNPYFIFHSFIICSEAPSQLKIENLLVVRDETKELVFLRTIVSLPAPRAPSLLTPPEGSAESRAAPGAVVGLAWPAGHLPLYPEETRPPSPPTPGLGRILLGCLASMVPTPCGRGLCGKGRLELSWKSHKFQEFQFSGTTAYLMDFYLVQGEGIH